MSSTDSLSAILDNLGEGLLMISPHWEILLYNKELERIYEELGWPTPEIGIPFSWGYGAPIVDRLTASIRNSVRDNIPTHTFAEFPTEEGMIYLEIKSIPVAHDGIINQIIVLFKDITTDKVFERRLSEMAANLTTLIEKASAVIIGTDSRGYITDWNRFCKEVTGYSKSEVYARKFLDVLTPVDYRTLLLETHRQAMDGTPVQNREIPVISKSGKHLTLLLSATVRSSRSGKPTGVIFVGQDITELIQYRESLEKIVQERTIKLKEALQKEKLAVDERSKFVSMVTHEFKTPLATMNGYIESLDQLRHITNTDNDYSDLLVLIKSQIARMRVMLDEVLDIEKSEVPIIKPVPREISLSQFANKITEEVLMASRGSHRINLTLRIANDSFMSDERFLRNIFLNLLNNAVKFSPGQSKVEFHISDKEDDIAFDVIDEGLGIPKEDQQRLFEPFRRSQNVDHIAGTGLGLSIVKRAVEVLGGTINVVSDVGVGSTFSVVLPRKLEHKAILK